MPSVTSSQFFEYIGKFADGIFGNMGEITSVSFVYGYEAVILVGVLAYNAVYYAGLLAYNAVYYAVVLANYAVY